MTIALEFFRASNCETRKKWLGHHDLSVTSGCRDEKNGIVLMNDDTSSW